MTNATCPVTTPPVHRSRWQRSAPALVLLVLAPLVAEVLPGATRLSSLMVLPIEITVWGGGALLIREAIRRWRPGWFNGLFLALALAVAEECLIQQTSFAPMVLQLKGQVYARAFGINYVYMLWALVYEVVFVVFVPIGLVELIFPQRAQDGWLGRGGAITVAVLFGIGSFLAWFSWTQIARPKVFHMPVYNPPLTSVLVAIAIVAALLVAGLFAAPVRAEPANTSVSVPQPWVAGLAGGLWAVVWYGLVLLGFGAFPAFPPAIAVAGGLAIVVAMLAVVPRWTSAASWTRRHAFALAGGTVFGAMAVSFIGFIGSTRPDLYFKIAADLVAAVLLFQLGTRQRA